MNRRNIALSMISPLVAAALFLTVSVTAQKSVSEANAVSPQATALMIEDFVYPTGQLTSVSGGTWVNFSGTGNFIPVSSGSLTYSGYPSSGKGNKIDIISVGTSAEDAYRQFVTQGVGTTVYGAFLVNVTNTTGLSANSSTTGDYFAGFLPSNSTTLLNARVSIRLGVGAGTYQLGLRATSANTSAVFSSTDLNPGTTYLVVLSYQQVSGNTNDVINMWINPALGGSEPPADLTQTTATTTDNADVARFFVRQGTTTTPNASLDGIRVGNSWASVTAPSVVTANTLDFNGDGKTDWALTRDASGLKNWWVLLSSTGDILGAQWGLSTDDLAPADYDGDGKTDLAIWRAGLPNQAAFYILQSETNTVKIEVFGQAGDRPRVVRDYDGDGKADVAVYREGLAPGSQSFFFYRGSSNNPSGNITYVPWGINGDIETSGDFDGDGKGDFCVRRNIGGSGVFILLRSGGGVEYVWWGLPTDGIVPGDYDGDGKSDFFVARVNGDNYNGYILTRTGGGTGAAPIVFGSVSMNDAAAFGDYDGDGRTDIGIWRPSADPTQNFFWVRLTATGTVVTQEWGQSGDQSVAEWNVTGGN
jgi:hypothetical protein